jgi:hypothetical protein
MAKAGENKPIYELGSETRKPSSLILQDVSLYKQTALAPLPLPTSVKELLEMNKTKMIIMRCSVAEKKIICRMAEKCGMGLSEYCRKQAIQGEVWAIPKLSSEEVEYFHLLKSYCVNFNRIANLIRDKDPLLVNAIWELVNKLTQLQKRII